MRRQTSKPSIPGIITSSSTMSGIFSSIRFRHSSPLYAVATSKYSAVSFASRSLTLDMMSSTTRTLAVMTLPDETANGFQEARHRNGLGDVSLASALADHFFVAFHGESGDRDHGNGLQRLVFLDPFGDFQARDFRQLDVHQDQVGMMLARDVERLHAILGLQDVVAMGVQQIVEELHVELIVLHDQYGLQFGVHDVSLRRKQRGVTGFSASPSMRAKVLTGS